MKRLKLKKLKKKNKSKDHNIDGGISSNVRQRTIFFTIFITAIMLSSATITAFIFSGFNLDTQGSDKKESKDDPIDYVKNHFIETSCSEYSTNTTPVLIKSDAYSYIDNIDFKDLTNKSLNYTEVNPELLKIYPVKYYAYNYPLLSENNNIILSSGSSEKEAQLRTIFDLSNYTIRKDIGFSLNVYTETISGSDIEITLYKSDLNSRTAIENDYFDDIYNYKNDISLSDKKFFDFSLLLNSQNDFMVNISCFITLSVPNINQEKLYLLSTDSLTGYQDITVAILFSQQIKINNEMTSQLNLTFSTIIDNIIPTVNYTINPSTIEYEINDSTDTKASFSLYDEENTFYIYELNTKGEIPIENINLFSGLFLISDLAGNLLLENITYFRDIYYIKVYYPNYTKSVIPVLIESNCSEYIEAIKFYDSENNVLQHSEIDLENIIIKPIKILEANSPIINISQPITLNSTTPQNNTIVRMIYDISNYSIYDKINYNLILNISKITGEQINFSLVQNNHTSQDIISSGIFQENLDYSLKISSISQKYIDLSLYLSSNTSFSVNITNFLIPQININNSFGLFLVENDDIGKQNLTLYLNFTETLKVNGKVCDELNITWEEVIDTLDPILNYQLFVNHIIYSLEDEYMIYGTFSYYDLNNNLIIIDISSSGAIQIDSDISYLKGVFIIQDIAGNILIVNITYDRLLLNPDTQIIQEKDENDEKKDGIISFLSLELLIIILIAVGIISYITFSYKFKNRKKFLKNIVIKEED